MVFSYLIASIATASMQAIPSPLDGLQRCESIHEDRDKLSCYHREASLLIELHHSGVVIISTSEHQRQVPRLGFGRRTPTTTNDDVASLDRLESSIASSTVNSGGKRVYTLNDGSVWEQTDQNPTRMTPSPDTSAVVRRGSLGSYFIKIGNSPEIRVRRIN